MYTLQYSSCSKAYMRQVVLCLCVYVCLLPLELPHTSFGRLEYGAIRFLIVFKTHDLYDLVEKAFFSSNGIIFSWPLRVGMVRYIYHCLKNVMYLTISTLIASIIDQEILIAKNFVGGFHQQKLKCVAIN
jgi:hypothetical protein